MISVSLSNTQSILAFATICVLAAAFITLLVRMTHVSASGSYKGAKLSLEASNHRGNRKGRGKVQSKESRLGTPHARIRALSSSSDVQTLKGTSSSRMRTPKAT